MPLKVLVTEYKPGILVVSPSGYIDTSSYKVFEKEVNSALDASPQIVIFNLDKVPYISSIGLGIILRTKKLLKEKGGKLFMTNLQPKVQKIFKIIYSKPSQEIFPSLMELKAYLR